MFSVGDNVPEFVADATSDRSIRLSELIGNAHVVLYFYPKDNTPGCTREGQTFRDLYQEFQTAGCEVFGVSRDSLKSHIRFKEKQGFPFDLIADPDEALCNQFEVIKEKNMYGRKVMGIERSTFLIDHEQKLRAEWRKVRVPGHVESVLETVKEL